MKRMLCQITLIAAFMFLFVPEALALACTPHMTPYDFKRFIPRIFQFFSVQIALAHFVVLISLIVYSLWPHPKPPSAKFVTRVLGIYTFCWICWEYITEHILGSTRGYCIRMSDWQAYSEKFALYLVISGSCYGLYRAALYIPTKYQKKARLIAIVLLFATIPMPM